MTILVTLNLTQGVDNDPLFEYNTNHDDKFSEKTESDGDKARPAKAGEGRHGPVSDVLSGGG
jgi:hypothetical protein